MKTFFNGKMRNHDALVIFLLFQTKIFATISANEFPVIGATCDSIIHELTPFPHFTAMSALQLPEQVGVMILPECVLFPHGGLPLRIFEERYRQMLQDAIESHCFFAVAQQISDESDDPHVCAASVGTIGIVRASHEQKDGTSNLLLHGVIRVKFVKWLEGKSYPFAEIEPISALFEPEHQADAAAEMLRGSVEDAIAALPDEVQKAVMEMMNRTNDPVILADIVSQQFIHDPELRQHLLEVEAPAERVSWLCRALQQD